MAVRQFKASEISAFCLELQLMLKAGIAAGEALHLLADDEHRPALSAFLAALSQRVDAGEALHTALEAVGGLPDYAVHMIEAGEATGRLESALSGLSHYYDERDRLQRSIRSAVSYPLVLLCMVLFVIIVLIAKVLPVFNDVFISLGATLTGFAAFAMGLGGWINAHAGLLVGIFGGLALLFLLLLLLPPLRRALSGRRTQRRSRGRLAAAVGAQRFAAAMSMALASGLELDDALQLADRLADDAVMSERIAVCRRTLQQKGSFSEGIAASGIFEPRYARMIAVGVRTGSADTVMAEIARRCADEVEDGVESRVRRIEPTLVIVMSVLVGAILLSVMLPLMSIMSSLV